MSNSSTTCAAKHFIQHLLVKDPKKRYTADAALNHPWLKVTAHLSLAALHIDGAAVERRSSQVVDETLISGSDERIQHH